MSKKPSPGLSFVLLLTLIHKLHPVFKNLRKFNIAARIEKYIDDRGRRK